MLKYSLSRKVNILTLLYSGTPRKALCRQFQLDKRMLMIWDLRFKRYGLDGLIYRRLSHHHDEAFKKDVVNRFRNGEETLRQAAVNYDIPFPTLKYWLKKYDIS